MLLLLGIVIIALLGYVSLQKRYMSPCGVVVAVILGLIVLLSDFSMLLLIIAFFISSSLLTKFKYKHKVKEGVAESSLGRSYKQVLGAGAVAVTFSLLKTLCNIGMIRHNPAQGFFTVGFLGALSTSTSDTWAVEIGVLSKEQPRLITHLKKKVPKGISGGVTVLGEVASLLGSLFIGVIAIILMLLNLLEVPQVNPQEVLVITLIAGFIGEKFDSLLGALFQAKYYCPKCNEMADGIIHTCGNRTVYKGGVRWFTNEVVNIISTLAGSLIAILIYAFTS